MSETSLIDCELASPQPASFRDVMSRFVTGVTIMTSCRGDWVHGMTANAVSSVSQNPPLVLVCVQRGTEMHRLVCTAQSFALSILPASARELSNHFANSSRPRGDAGFADVETRTEVTGSPVLELAAAWLDCRIWRIYAGGDHDIVVGEVLARGLGEDVAVLGHHRSRYTTIG